MKNKEELLEEISKKYKININAVKIMYRFCENEGYSEDEIITNIYEFYKRKMK